MRSASLGLALGLTAAIYIFLLGLASLALDWGTGLAGVLIGPRITLAACLLGAGKGLITGYILGRLIAFFYNLTGHREKRIFKSRP